MTIDVIITSTCRKNLSSTLRSFKEKIVTSVQFNYLVHVDVFESNKAYLPTLLDILSDHGITDVSVNHDPRGHAHAINYLYGRIKSKYFFHLEDDWVFLQSIDFDSLFKLIDENRGINQIRFNKEKVMPVTEQLINKLTKTNELYLLPGLERLIDGVRLIESNIWSFNPHIARTEIIKKIPPVPVNINPEDYIFKKYHEYFMSGGLYIYGGYNDPPRIRDTGRPSIYIAKFSKAIKILKNPKLISKKNRLLLELKYKGKSWET